MALRRLAACRGRGARSIALATALLLAACGPVRRQPAVGPSAPAALATFSADAADLVSSGGGRDWSVVSAQLAALEQAWSVLRPAAGERGATPGLLAAVDSAVTALASQADLLSARGTQTAANRVTAFVPDLMALWPAPFPPQLAEMQYLTRAIELDVAAGRTTPLWSLARTLGTQWSFIRNGARARDAADAAQLDAELPPLGSAVSALLSGHAASAPPVARPAAAPLRASGAITAASSVLAPSASAAAPSASAAAPSSSRAAPLRSSLSSTPAAGRGGPAPQRAPASTAPVAAAAAAILQTLGALQRAYQGRS